MSRSSVIAPFQTERHDHSSCRRDALARAEDICLRKGLRLTELRRRVLELVWSGHEPVRAYDLLDQLRGERRGAAPPTVYRALDFLQEHGFVHKIESLNAYVGCAEPADRHGGQFLICRRCKAVAELDDPAIHDTVQRRAEASGFVVQGQVIEVTGLCPRCAADPAAPQPHAHEH